MAIAMFMSWPTATVEQYEAVRKIVDWEGDRPPGGLLHVAAFDEGGMHVTDLWDSAEQFQAFVDQRLMPGVAQVGIQSQPEIKVLPVHALWAPAFT